MLSCSTCWNSARHTDGEAMLRELTELGFEQVELGHGVRLSLMEGVLKAVEKGVKISSLHNFCPLPIEIPHASPDCYEFSADDARERERAVRQTLQTIDFAARLGAKRVVLHLGSVPLADYTGRLVKMAEAGQHLSRAYVRQKLEAVQRREEAVQPFWERARECLKRIAEHAAERGVTLGVESRHSYEELPHEREMLQVLEEFPAPTVGYWHDFGHVQVKHNLGFLDHRQWMSKVAGRLVGCHLHDTIWPGRDHQAPFSGDVPYPDLLAMLPRDTLFVFEMSPRRTREEIVSAREKWIALFGA